MLSEQLTAKCLQVVSLPEVASCFVVEWHLRLIGQHEIAVIKQAGPMLFSAWKVAAIDFMAALVEKLIADHVAGANVRGEKRVPLIHVEGVQVPLHGPVLCETQNEFGARRHTERGQENASKMPGDKNG